MPQFNPEWFASQLLWLAITFTLLYLLMSRIALPRMNEVVEGRQQKVQDDLDKAEKLRNEAQEINQAYERQLQEARSEAQKIMRETGEAIGKEHNENLAEFAREMDQRIEEAETRIAQSKAEALDSIDSVAADLAKDAANKLIGTKVGDSHARKAVQAAEGGE